MLEVQSVVEHSPPILGNHRADAAATRLSIAGAYEKHPIWATRSSKRPCGKSRKHREVDGYHHRYSQESTEVLPDGIDLLFIAVNQVNTMPSGDPEKMGERLHEVGWPPPIRERQIDLVECASLTLDPFLKLAIERRRDHRAKAARHQMLEPAARSYRRAGAASVIRQIQRIDHLFSFEPLAMPAITRVPDAPSQAGRDRL